jgi:hypothetical protein
MRSWRACEGEHGAGHWRLGNVRFCAACGGLSGHRSAIAELSSIYDGVDAPPRHRCAKVESVEHHLREGSVSEVIIIGLDIAKHVFHAHGADERGRALFTKRIS